MALSSPSPRRPVAPAPVASPDPNLAQDPIYYRALPQARAAQLRELYDILLRGKWIILASVLLVAIPTTIYTMQLPARYRAYSLLLIEKQSQNLAQVLPSASGNTLLRGNNSMLGNELLVLRQSESLADSAARVIMQHEVVPGTESPLTIRTTGDGQELSLRALARRLQSGYIQAEPEGNGVDAIRVSAVSTNPHEAAFLANVYAQAFVDRTQNVSREGMSASRAFLEQQVARQREALEQADNNVRDFMLREGAVSLDEETTNIVTQLAQLEAQRDAVNVSIRMKQATVAALEDELRAIEPRLVDFVASGAQREINAAQDRIAILEGRLETIYLHNPELRDAEDVPEEVRRDRNEIAQLQARVRQLTQAYLEEAVPVGAGQETGGAVGRVTQLRTQLINERIELSGLEAQRDVLVGRIGEYERELQAIPGQATGLAQLQRERSSTEGLYLALEQKLQEMRVAEQSELGYAQLVRSATPPAKPFSPDRPRNILLGIVLGLGLGIALAIARTRLDHRLHRPDDLRDMGYTVLGTIPDMNELIAKDFQGADAITVGEQTFDTRLVSLLNPMAIPSESYRALRTNIQFSRPDVVIETVLVTSPSPSEGKSVTAANLALVMAQAGRRVLLVDTDLRRPTVHKKFGVSREPGLVQLLFNDAPFDPTPFETAVEDLWIIPAGASAPNPSELLGSRAMRELAEEFRQHFDVVIYDAPPVLAATDAVVLSTQSDATLVVAHAGKTKDFELGQAMEALTNVGAPVIGTVLNGFDVSKAYGYRYKYQYRYGYEYADKPKSA